MNEENTLDDDFRRRWSPPAPGLLPSDWLEKALARTQGQEFDKDFFERWTGQESKSQQTDMDDPANRFIPIEEIRKTLGTRPNPLAHWIHADPKSKQNSEGETND